MVSPQVFTHYLSLTIHLLTSLQITQWLNMHFLLEGWKDGERYDTPVGKSQHLPPPKPPRTPMPFLRGTTFHLQTKGLGEHPGTLWGHSLSPGLDQRYLGGSGLQHISGMDKSKSSQGTHNGGGSRNTVCLHLQWTWLALCPHAAVWVLQPHSPSQGQAFRHPAPRKGVG